jgi:hypothetical protein
MPLGPFLGTNVCQGLGVSGYDAPNQCSEGFVPKLSYCLRAFATLRFSRLGEPGEGKGRGD